MKKSLWIDLSAGISADRFAAALIGLGVPVNKMVQVIKETIEGYGFLDAHIHLEFLADDVVAHRLHLVPLSELQAFSWGEAPNVLEKNLDKVGVTGVYADFARKVISILQETIRQNTLASSPAVVSLPVIGTAHTPYDHQAPYQPRVENAEDGIFYIEVDQRFADGLNALDSFSYIYVLSYLDRSIIPEITVTPPWKEEGDQYGVFATRSPNRPSPIGLTRVRLLRLEGKRIYTGPLDLFDGTPVMDVKPYIQTLDSAVDDDLGNDGWLAGSDHLELHRLGIPHAHPSVSGSSSQPLLLVASLVGVAWGLQHLSVDCESVICTSPVNTGIDYVLEPAAQAILEQHKIPNQPGTDSDELVTPDGAAILAALSPKFIKAEDMPSEDKNIAYGLGGKYLNSAPAFGALPVSLVEQSTQE